MVFTIIGGFNHHHHIIPSPPICHDQKDDSKRDLDASPKPLLFTHGGRTQGGTATTVFYDLTHNRSIDVSTGTTSPTHLSRSRLRKARAVRWGGLHRQVATRMHVITQEPGLIWGDSHPSSFVNQGSGRYGQIRLKGMELLTPCVAPTGHMQRVLYMAMRVHKGLGGHMLPAFCVLP